MIDMGAEYPIAVSFLVGLIAVLGVVAAFMARNGIRREEKLLEDGWALVKDNRENGQGNWGDKTTAETWLASVGLEADSHFGDRIKSVWGGWLVGRVPTLMELHDLSNGRERRRFSARLTGGITALLVVSGIAGTLVCIHPVLKEFDPSGDAAGVVDSSERMKSAKTMIQSLGEAFYPSLTALLFTLVVASGRGYYLHAASKLAWRLDSFTVDELFPSFRLRTFGEELLDMQSKVSRLIDAIQTRDKRVGTLVETLTTTVTALGNSQTGLQSAAENVAKAAEKLSGEAGAVRSDLATYLGEQSNLVHGLTAVALAAQANQQAAETLVAASTRLASSAESGAQALEETCRASAAEAAAAVSGAAENAASRLEQSIAGFPQHVHAATLQAGQAVVEASRLAAKENVATLCTQVEPIRTVATEVHLANAVLQSEVRASLNASVAEFGKSGSAVLKRFQSTIGATATELVSSGKAIHAAVEAAQDLLDRVEAYRNVPAWPRRIWTQVIKFFRRA